MEEGVYVFLSYAHKDKVLRDRLVEHLSLLKRQGVISIWHDRDISAGTGWQQAIDMHLNNAHLILLLVSPAFMASEYCYGKEMKRALERHEAKEAWVIPILIRPVDWQDAPFGKLQVLPPNAHPVTMWRNRDKAFLDITRGIRNAVEELTLKREAGSPTSMREVVSEEILDNAMSSNSGISSKGTPRNEDEQTKKVKAATIVFGIDLGTTYSCIAYVDKYGQAVVIPNMENSLTTPSVVQFQGNNRIVGEEAKNNAMLDPGDVVEMVKRRMGEADWRFRYDGIAFSAEEISSYILRKLAAYATMQIGTEVRDVVITCPACFGIPQREAVARAGEIAGLNVKSIINEPTATAIYYSLLQEEQDQVVLVYDLGGGTFDITVIRIGVGKITVVATGGDDHLGGRDWDARIVSYLAEQWKNETGSTDDPVDSVETRQDLWLLAERAKTSLTVRTETRVRVTHEGHSVGVTLTRDKFDELTATLLERTITFTRSIMEEAKQRTVNHFDYILLVGGSTKMPQVLSRLQREFSTSCKLIEPGMAVAKGAAIYGQAIYGQKLPIDTMVERKVRTTQVGAAVRKQAEVDVAYRKVTDRAGNVVTAGNANTRPNFFMLLDLNPDAPWSDAVYHKALADKRDQWGRDSTAGISPRDLVAQGRIRLVPEIKKVMEDPALRALEAITARSELANTKKQRLDDFERELAFSNARTSIEQIELDKFIEAYQDILTAQQITDRITVLVRASGGSAPLPPQLDPVMAKNISDRLEMLHLASLYELLGAGTDKLSATQLCDLADKLFLETVRRAHTEEDTVKKELAGYAKDVFKSEESRKKYDETLRLTSLNALLKKLDRIMSRVSEKVVHVGQVALFLEEAQKAGWSRTEALSRLQEHARLRKWSLEVPAKDQRSEKICCGLCRHLNDRGQHFCSACNEALYFDCPDCGQKIPCEYIACGRCGFPVGNRYRVKFLLAEIDLLLKKGDLEGADKVLSEAESAWQPKKAEALAQKISALRTKTIAKGTVQGSVQVNYNTVTLMFQDKTERTIPFLAPPQSSRELVGRAVLLQGLKQQLFAGGSLALSALHGLPGVGKTALALALAHEREVLGHFCDGVLWAGLGRESNVLAYLSTWGIALGIPQSEIEKQTNLSTLTQAVHKAIGSRRMLLVIDDAWSVEAALAFKLGGPHCAHVVTTRLPQVAEAFAGGGTVVVQELSEDDGLKLLEQLAPGVTEMAPGEARELVRVVGGLPLQLTLMGKYLRVHMQTGQPRRLRAALDRLKQVHERLQLSQPQAVLERHPSLPEDVPLSLLEIIKMSDEALNEEARQALRALSVFPSKPNS
jgi:molecular chaperone DnaK